ncbi:hypothetical protein PMIN02_003487 [Paraphaeosphaeria minitans]
MLVTQAKILSDANDEETFDLGEKSAEDTAIFVQTLYKASSVSTANTQDALCMLRMLLDVVIEVAGSLGNRLHNIKMQTAVGRMWETTFVCMHAIAHREMLSKHAIQLFKPRLVHEVIETERLLWCDWVCNMRASVVEEGEPLSVSASRREYLWSSILWWHRRISEMRTLDVSFETEIFGY